MKSAMLKDRTFSHISDKAVIVLLSPILFVIFLIYMIPVILSVWLMTSTEYFQSVEPAYLAKLLGIYINFKGLPNDIIATAVHSLPALIGAICYRRSTNQKLNKIGWILFIFFLVGVIMSFISLVLLNPDVEAQWSNADFGKDGLERLHADIEASLRTVITFIALFLGLKVSIESEIGADEKSEN